MTVAANPPPHLASPSHHPLLGLAALMRQNVAGKVMAPLAQELIEQASADPSNACALLDANVIVQFYGNQPLARQLQDEALKIQRHYIQPSHQPARLRLLALMAPGSLEVNVPLECVLEHSDIELHQYYLTRPDDDLTLLPEHDVLFVAMCETEANRPLLQMLATALADWPRPVLNRPQHIPRVARNTASALLATLPGVYMPPNLRLPRGQVQALAQTDGIAVAQTLGLAFPLLVRPLDTHAGNGLHKVDNPAMLAEVLDTLPDAELFVTPFVDYRSADGQFRKYRVMLIGGQPYVAHGAISSHWMIHYVNAGMDDDTAKRAEEADFMASFNTGFAQRHAAAFAAMQQALELDYWGMDCAEMPDGRLLVFEVDTAMVVHAMDSVERYPYKQAIMQRLFAAFRALVFQQAGMAAEATP
ncbi:MAG: ATP-grasp domain-containing protein [Macromonas sp.]